MPPKAAKTQRKGAASGSDVCSICCQKIGPKDEVLFCSGSCQKHLHRYCASVSEQSFKMLTSGDAPPFLCFCCFRAKKDEEVAKLLSTVDLLKEEINALKSKRMDDDQRPSPAPSAGQLFAKKGSSTESGEPTAHSVSNTSRAAYSESSVSHNLDSKYNVVLYGVEECRSGLSRSARFESDLSSVIDIFSALDSSIQPQSIRDCYRLGKFSPGGSRPRPILIKFVRMADVTRLFTKKRNLSNPFSIKPDMSRAQRQQESILMQERWRLIQSGVSRKNIRVRGDSLYVNNRMHGSVSKLKFKHVATGSGAPCLSQTSSPRRTSPKPDIPVRNIPVSPQATSPLRDSCLQGTSSGSPIVVPPQDTPLVSNSCLQDTPSSCVDISATPSAPDQSNTDLPQS